MKAAAKVDLAVAALAVAAAYWLWPAGALAKPESSMSPGEVLRVLGALLSGAIFGLGGVLKALKDAR